MQPEVDFYVFCLVYAFFWVFFHKPDMPDPGWLHIYAGDIKDFD